MNKKFVTVYCSHATTLDADYYDMAKAVGHGIADAQFGLIYGGADRGVMGAVADAVLERQGHVIGVVPSNVERLNEVAHKGLTELIRTEYMQERKRVMYERTNAFIVLPGGFGTLDEVFEVLTLRKLGIHHRPMYFLNFRDFWNPMRDMLERMIEVGTMDAVSRTYYRFFDTIPELMDLLAKDPEITD